jgi:putative membrane protein
MTAWSGSVGLVAAWHRGDMMDGGGGHWGWMVVVLIVALAFLGVLAWAISRHSPGGAPAGTGMAGAPAAPTARAREVLAERMARGEISVEEYQERLHALG